MTLTSLAAAAMIVASSTPYAIEEPGENTEFQSNLYTRNSEINIYARLNGPTFDGPVGQTYNVYTGDKSPAQLYTSLTYSYSFNPKTSVGFELAATKYLVSDIESSYGPVSMGWSFSHPVLQFYRYGLVDNSLFTLDGRVQAFIPTSDFSRIEQGMITSVSVEQTWTLKPLRGRWGGGFTTRIQPYIYTQSVPSEESPSWRKVLYLSTGHFLSYQFSPLLQLYTSTKLDVARWGGWGSDLFYNAEDDRAEVMLNIFPDTRKTRLGASVLIPMFGPELRKTSLGLEASLYF